jgi:hypothetical protein
LLQSYEGGNMTRRIRVLLLLISVVFSFNLFARLSAQSLPPLPPGYDETQRLLLNSATDGRVDGSLAQVDYALFVPAGAEVTINLIRLDDGYIPSLRTEVIGGGILAEAYAYFNTVKAQTLIVLFDTDTWVGITVLSEGSEGVYRLLAVSDAADQDVLSDPPPQVADESDQEPLIEMPAGDVTIIPIEDEATDESGFEDETTPEFDEQPEDTEILVEPEATPTATGLMGSAEMTAPTQPIQVGQSVNGTLESGRFDAWAFEAFEGDLINLRLESSAFDALLELYTPSGRVLQRDDDTGVGLNAQIGGVRLRESGTYRVIVRSYNASASGAYQLTLDSGGAVGNSQSRRQASLTLSTPTNGRLTSGEGDLWTFTGREGDILTISLNSTDFDTILNLYAPGGELLQVNDDGGEGTNSQIDFFRVPAGGEYTVWARSYNASASGAYTLTVTPSGELQLAPSQGGGLTAQPTFPPGSNTIAYGSSINGSLSRGAGIDYRFNANANDVVTIDLVSGAFDAYLELYGPDGRLITQDDDGGNGLNSRILNRRLSSGTHMIRARSYSNSGSGSFTLTLTLSQSGGSAPSRDRTLGYGDTSNALLDMGGNEDYTFTASTGDVVTIALNSNEFDSYLELYGPDGQLIARDDDGGGSLNSLIRNQRLNSGTHTIRVRSFGDGGGGAYTLTLTRVQAGASAATTSTQVSSSGGSSGGSSARCGGRDTLFTVGDVAVVDFNSPGSLRLLQSYDSERIVTVALAYDNTRLTLLEGPICYADKWYWRVRHPGGLTGWAAESSPEFRWMCPSSEPECT